MFSSCPWGRERGARSAAAGGSYGDSLLLAQFEKVRRVRTQWKVSLKAVHGTIDGAAYAFQFCDGEFVY